MKTYTEAEKHLNEADNQLSLSERCIASCRKLLAQIENVKGQVIAEFRDGLDEHQRVLELAVSEAEALAWQEELPQLLFPTLATEKAQAVASWHTRQQALSRRAFPRLMAA